MTNYGDEDIYDLRMLADELRELIDSEENDLDEQADIGVLVGLAEELANTRQAMTPAEAADKLQEIGDNYEPTLIRDSYFTTYAEELADDIGAIDRDARWPLNHIDWEAAASELQMDYTSVTLDGIDYWIRSW